MDRLDAAQYRDHLKQIDRRSMLRAGMLGAAGLALPSLLRWEAKAEAQGKPTKRATSVIILWMRGGPSQHETWDPKPEAPAEVRGEFRAIATRVPGVRVSEHFPRLARLADRYAIIRSLTHDDPAHLSSVHHLLTGHHAPKVKSDADPPSRRDSPAVGSVLARLRPTGTAGVVSAFCSSGEPASADWNERSSAAAISGRNADAGAVTTSARAFAYRVATAECVMA
jgi:hypothetical protein